MQGLYELLSNIYLIAGISSWAVAQIIKTILYAAINHTVDFRRLVGDGGMPSGHSAFVASLATSSALVYGLGSFPFAISAMLAIIVCHDAKGVRLETGKQAEIINDMIELLFSPETAPETKLKELVGHTPMQVFAGVLLGILNTLLIFQIMG